MVWWAVDLVYGGLVVMFMIVDLVVNWFCWVWCLC